MKKALYFAVLLTCVLSLSNAAYAADSSVLANKKSTFFDSFMEGIRDFFSGNKAGAENVDMGGARGSLLELLNRYELFVRTSVSGGDMYLKRDSILVKLEDAKMAVSDSREISSDHKTRLLQNLELIEGNLKLNLVESPQDKTKPVILNAFDKVEAMVFKMSQEEASEVLKIISDLGISPVNL